MWWYLAKVDQRKDKLIQYNEIIKFIKPSSYLYNKMIDMNSEFNLMHRLTKVNQLLHDTVPMVEFCKYFHRLYKIAKDTKSRDFQFRQLHMCLYPNSLLVRWGVVENNLCEFCGQEQTLKHLFWECSHVQKLYQYITEIIGTTIDVTFKLIFFCMVDGDAQHIANEIILKTKM